MCPVPSGEKGSSCHLIVAVQQQEACFDARPKAVAPSFTVCDVFEKPPAAWRPGQRVVRATHVALGPSPAYPDPPPNTPRRINSSYHGKRSPRIPSFHVRRNNSESFWNPRPSPGQGAAENSPAFQRGVPMCPPPFFQAPRGATETYAGAACEWTLSPLPGLRDIDSARSAPGLKNPLGYYLSPRFGA